MKKRVVGLFVLILCIALVTGCTDSINQQNPSIGDNELPINWVVRYGTAPQIDSNNEDGRWYLFNLYTIDEITPDNMEYLRLTFEQDKELSLERVDTTYEGASNFRAWVYIPNSYIENQGVGFTVNRPDGKKNRDLEANNLYIWSHLRNYDGKLYFANSIPCEENPDAAEFRKVVRTWEDVPLQEQTIDVSLNYDPMMETGDLSFVGLYTCSPTNDGSSSTKSNIADLYVTHTKTGDVYSVTMKHMYS